MGARIDYDRMSDVYDEGRALRPESLEGWRAVLSTHLGPRVSHPVLDLGAGTGIWSVLLADWFELDEVAVEVPTRLLGYHRDPGPEPLGSSRPFPLARDEMT